MVRPLTRSRPLVPILLGALATPAAAQKFKSSPPGFLTIEGSGAAFDLGRYKEGRVMFLDGEVRGAAMGLRGIDVRPDYFWTNGPNIVGTTWRSEGRTWRRVVLTMSECDVARASSTFTRNALTTPTTVLDAQIVWPTITGTPATRPARWGHTSGRLRFPFIRPWAYSGRRDLCADFVFTGGVLANRGTWMGRDEAYALDSFVTGRSAASTILGKQFGRSLGSGGCIDNRNRRRWGGIGYPGLTVYATTHPDPTLRGKLDVSSVARETAPNGAVIHGIDVIGNAAGFPVPGLGCNRLHLLPATSALFPDVANANGWSYRRHARLSYAPAMTSVQVWGQSAWADSASGALLLTSAFRSEVPQMPRTYKRLCVLSPDPSWATGTQPHPAQQCNPLFRYVH